MPRGLNCKFRKRVNSEKKIFNIINLLKNSGKNSIIINK